MKKILVFALALVLLVGAAEAQKKNTNKKTSRVTSSSATQDKNNDGTVTAPNTIMLPVSYHGLDASLHQALKHRESIRQLSSEDIPEDILSSLLWATYGYNRPDQKKRVAPSAVNAQEFDIYVFTRDGIYLYDAEKNSLNPVAEGDHRSEISEQKHFVEAPISIVLVANFDRMKRFGSDEDRNFYAAVDCGYISQNIYLYCSAAELGTVACGAINRDLLHKLLGIKNGRAMIAHPIGHKM